MGIVDRLVEGSTAEIDVGGDVFRLRRPSVGEFLSCMGQIQHVAGLVEARIPEDVRAKLDAAEDKEASEIRAKYREPDETAEIMVLTQQVVCASVRAARDGDEWIPLRFVMSEEDEDPRRGIVWVGALSLGVLNALGEAASALAVPEEAAKVAAAFRGGSDAGAVPAQDGAGLRPAAA